MPKISVSVEVTTYMTYEVDVDEANNDAIDKAEDAINNKLRINDFRGLDISFISINNSMETLIDGSSLGVIMLDEQEVQSGEIDICTVNNMMEEFLEGDSVEVSTGDEYEGKYLIQQLRRGNIKFRLKGCQIIKE